jgi:hypothetical protein
MIYQTGIHLKLTVPLSLKNGTFLIQKQILINRLAYIFDVSAG